MTNNQLINDLVSDLKPRKALSNTKFWQYIFMCFVIVSSLILGILGIRADYMDAMAKGSMFWKPAIFLCAGIGTMGMVIDLSRPMGRIKWGRIGLLGAAFLISILQYFHQINLPDLFNQFRQDDRAFCFSIILIGGAIGLVSVWQLWLKHTASSAPQLLGALSGFGAGCFAATAYALHCDKDEIIYVFVYYGLSLLILTGLGFFMGKRVLKW
jgi:hypothetical protein